MNKLLLIPVILSSLILFNSCTDHFTSLNTPPHQSTLDDLGVSEVGQAFARSQFTSVNLANYEVSTNLYGDMYAQYFALTQQNFISDRNNEVGGWSNAVWNSFYNNVARGIHFVDEYTLENDLHLENAVNRVWKVASYHRITDIWGPIIYSEFGNAETRVDYDSQESIYKSFFQELDAAVDILGSNLGSTAFAGHDQIFNGNIDQWYTFANSLRLRLAMKIKYVEPELARQEAEKAVAAGVITSNEDNADLETTDNSPHTLSLRISNYDNWRMSAAMESIMVGYDDPRLPEYFNEVEIDNREDGRLYHGLRNGHPVSEISDDDNNYHSHIDTKWWQDAQGGSNPPYKIMGAAEVYLLRAEGAVENWEMGGTARSLYEQGIEMSIMEYTDASVQDIQTYITSENTPVEINDRWNTPAISDIPVAFDENDTERQKEQIGTQKWLALFPDGLEAWAEAKRTGYPKLHTRLASDNPDVPADAIMRRLTIVPGEHDNNNAAVEAALQMEELSDGDRNSTRVWWDVKPVQ